MEKIKLTLKSLLTRPRFDDCLDKLGEDPGVGMRDRYALGRTATGVREHLAEYERQRVKLVKEVGKPELEIITTSIAQLEADPAFKDAPQVLAMKDRVKFLEKGHNSYMVDETDPEAIKKFNAAIDELQSAEVELWLDHKIVLSENTKLTSREMAVLDAVISLPSEEAATPAK